MRQMIGGGVFHRPIEGPREPVAVMMPRVCKHMALHRCPGTATRFVYVHQ